jgi:hypothetical protein
MERFFYQERNNGGENYDKIIYSAGPADICILGYEEIIEIKLRFN